MSELELPRARYLPWQQLQKERLQQQITANRLPHALLFSGIKDIGKKDFAFAFGAQLLCTRPGGGSACNQCSSCHLLNASTHPDLRLVRPEESKLIVIEQIRDLTEWVVQTAQQGGCKVCILFPAEQMNVQSANALLKCLEEPGPDTFFILVTDQPGRLLPTVRSRCQRVEFQVPHEEEAIPWLQSCSDSDVDISLLLALAAGAPMKVVKQFDGDYLNRRARIMGATDGLIQGKVTAVAAAASLLSKEYPVEIYDVLYGLFSDALKLTLSSSNNTLINKDMESFINVISNKFSCTAMLLVIDCVNMCRRAVTGSSNPNPTLLLESLLIKLDELASSEGSNNRV
ncbi:MAG: DNA polymerase III subunit delta' [Gammaproteobacteria bacterium]|nr:DNA polymerase III subunit delta' [Gammaproteobacteria bacterium]